MLKDLTIPNAIRSCLLDYDGLAEDVRTMLELGGKLLSVVVLVTAPCSLPAAHPPLSLLFRLAH